jgi:DNA-binding transcriptional LysR family regulator
MTRQIKKRFYDEGLVPNILLYAVQLPLIKQFVYSGKAGTFLSKELAESLPEIIAIPLKEKVPINFALVWNKDKFRSRNLRILTDYILAKSPIQK